MCKSKSRILLVLGVTFVVALMSCGGQSAEKRMNVDRNLWELRNLVGETNEVVDRAIARGFMDNQAIAEYNLLVDAVNELLSLNLSEATNDELDEVLAACNQMKVDISTLKGTLEGVLAR